MGIRSVLAPRYFVKAHQIKKKREQQRDDLKKNKKSKDELKKKPTTPAGDKYCAWCDNNGFASSAYTHNEDKCGRKKAANK